MQKGPGFSRADRLGRTSLASGALCALFLVLALLSSPNFAVDAAARTDVQAQPGDLTPFLPGVQLAEVPRTGPVVTGAAALHEHVMDEFKTHAAENFIRTWEKSEYIAQCKLGKGFCLSLAQEPGVSAWRRRVLCLSGVRYAGAGADADHLCPAGISGCPYRAARHHAVGCSRTSGRAVSR